MLKFYFSGAPNPTKVALFLEEAGVAYEAIPVDTRKGDQFKPEFLAVNPNSKSSDDGNPTRSSPHRPIKATWHVARTFVPATIGHASKVQTSSSRNVRRSIALNNGQPLCSDCTLWLSRWWCGVSRQARLLLKGSRSAAILRGELGR